VRTAGHRLSALVGTLINIWVRLALPGLLKSGYFGFTVLQNFCMHDVRASVASAFRPAELGLANAP
jgi:hypothetical protein